MAPLMPSFCVIVSLCFVLLIVVPFRFVGQCIAPASIGGKSPHQTITQDYPRTTRIAYLITVNKTSPHTIRLKQILMDIGFTVQLEFAPTSMITEDKVLSNKLAQLTIYTRIIEDKSRELGGQG